jgi:hypothetical protein
MAPTDTTIRNTKVDSKPKKLSDGGGLFLLLNPNGSRWCRLKYRVDGKEKFLSLGTYPDVSLREARERRDDARKQLSAGQGSCGGPEGAEDSSQRSRSERKHLVRAVHFFLDVTVRCTRCYLL